MSVFCWGSSSVMAGLLWWDVPLLPQDQNPKSRRSAGSRWIQALFVIRTSILSRPYLRPLSQILSGNSKMMEIFLGTSFAVRCGKKVTECEWKDLLYLRQLFRIAHGVWVCWYDFIRIYILHRNLLKGFVCVACVLIMATWKAALLYFLFDRQFLLLSDSFPLPQLNNQCILNKNAILAQQTDTRTTFGLKY